MPQAKIRSLISPVHTWNEVCVSQLLMTKSDPGKPLPLLMAQVLRSFSNMPDTPSMGQTADDSRATRTGQTGLPGLLGQLV